MLFSRGPGPVDLSACRDGGKLAREPEVITGVKLCLGFWHLVLCEVVGAGFQWPSCWWRIAGIRRVDSGCLLDYVPLALPLNGEVLLGLSFLVLSTSG